MFILFFSCEGFKIISPVIIFLTINLTCSIFISHFSPFIEVYIQTMRVFCRICHDYRRAFIHSDCNPERVFKSKKRLHHAIYMINIRNCQRFRRDFEDFSKFLYQVSFWSSCTGLILRNTDICRCLAEANKLTEVLLSHTFIHAKVANSFSYSHNDTSRKGILETIGIITNMFSIVKMKLNKNI